MVGLSFVALLLAIILATVAGKQFAKPIQASTLRLGVMANGDFSKDIDQAFWPARMNSVKWRWHLTN